MGIFCFGYTRLEWIFVTLPNAKSPDWGHFFKIAFGVLMVPVLRYNGKHGEQSMEVLTDNILQEVRLLCVHNSSVLTLWLSSHSSASLLLYWKVIVGKLGCGVEISCDLVEWWSLPRGLSGITQCSYFIFLLFPEALIHWVTSIFLILQSASFRPQVFWSLLLLQKVSCRLGQSCSLNSVTCSTLKITIHVRVHLELCKRFVRIRPKCLTVMHWTDLWLLWFPSSCSFSNIVVPRLGKNLFNPGGQLCKKSMCPGFSIQKCVFLCLADPTQLLVWISS